MREIKFRAWDKNGERWMTPTVEDIEESEVRLTLWGDVTFRLPWFAEVGDCSTTVVGNDMFEITQYTGLKDKNGVEIYEGDVVTFEINNYERTGGKVSDKTVTDKVTYGSGCFQIDGVPLYVPHFDELDITVIGNIYENPELQEENK